MDKITKLLEGLPYSEHEVKRAAENKCNIVLYSELGDVNDIFDILKPYGACIILYETKPNYGHWTALMSNKVKGTADKEKRVLEYFDSYGMPMDDAIERNIDNIRSILPEKWLSRLVKQAADQGKIDGLIWNNKRLQAFKPGVATCGRWCALRVAMRWMPLSKFQEKFIGQTFNPDYYATIMTLYNDAPAT
jgi:hypothetical protein